MTLTGAIDFRGPILLSNTELFVRILLSAMLGSFIGIERERLLWTAGLRTHMLVRVGACLMMIVSAFGFGDALGDQHVVLDPSRIAAQVVSGIGFLGAGTILLRGEVIKGLTTAASLWTVAAIGLAVGGGLYVAALLTTGVILLILAGIKPLEDRFRTQMAERVLSRSARRGAITLQTIVDIAGVGTSRVKQFTLYQQDKDALDEITVAFARLPEGTAEEIADRLRAIDGVAAATLVH
ncbi:hypothetical protein LMIY3S_05481 [Labrys miyagiensis]